VPTINLPQEVFDLAEKFLPEGTETNIIDKVRLGLVLIKALKELKIPQAKIMEFVGYSHNDASLTNYLKEKVK
jgi:hypothetical protein